MKPILYSLIVFCCLLSVAQPPDVLAKAAYLKAQELYGNAEYEQATVKLDDVVRLLGSTNPRIEFLRVQCYYEMKNAEKAQQALAAYFKVAADDDPNYMQMLTRVEDVKSMASLMAKSIKLVYNLTEGQSFEMSMSSTTEGSYTGPDFEITGRHTVLAINGNTYRMKYEISDMKTPASVAPMAGPAFAGKSLEYTMDKAGTITGIEGVSELVAQVNLTIKETKMKSAERYYANSYAAMYTSNDIWKSILSAASPHTNELVYPGKEWVKNESMTTPAGTITTDLTCKLESITGALAKISVTGTSNYSIAGTNTTATISGLLTINTTTGIVANGSLSTIKEVPVTSSQSINPELARTMMARVPLSVASTAKTTVKTTTTFRSN